MTTIFLIAVNSVDHYHSCRFVQSPKTGLHEPYGGNRMLQVTNCLKRLTVSTHKSPQLTHTQKVWRASLCGLGPESGPIKIGFFAASNNFA